LRAAGIGKAAKIAHCRVDGHDIPELGLLPQLRRVHRLDAELMNVLQAGEGRNPPVDHGIEYYSVQTVVQKSSVNELIPKLRLCVAIDRLEIPIAKIVA